MSDTRQLPNEVQLVKSDIFYPTGDWSIRKSERVLHRKLGWRKYYEALPADGCYFMSQEDAAIFLRWFEDSEENVAKLQKS